MKYNSVFYNNDRYYDPTAGAALINAIRQERKSWVPMPKPERQERKRWASMLKPERQANDLERFAVLFRDEYVRTHPPRVSGKTLKYGDLDRVRKHLKIYEYCIQHCDEDDFSVDEVVKRFSLGSDRIVWQCFSGRGDIGKLIAGWKKYKEEQKHERL